MKKLLQNCLLLCLVVGALLYLGGAAYRQTNAYRNLERSEETEHYHSMPSKIDIAVFGASHGRDAFQFFPNGSSAFNFSMSSQTPRYDAALLRQYEERIQPGATVILTISYITPFWSEREKDFQSKQERYYRILDAQNIINVDWAHFMLGRFSPLFTTDYSQILHAFYPGEALLPTAEEQYGHHQISAADMPSEQERIRRDHLSCIAPTFPEVNPVMWVALEEMLDCCAENGWNAVLVTPPYLAAYTACFPPEFYPIFSEKMQAMSEAYQIPFLDYSHDTSFTQAYSLFKNIDHFNLSGSEQFNRQFFADLPAALTADSQAQTHS